MKYLNLTDGFNPYNSLKSQIINFETFYFNGGEPHIKIDVNGLMPHDVITITHKICNMNDLGILMVAVNALSGHGVLHKYLYVPYFPGARQDRIMIEGEPLTVKVYADIINKMRFSGVTILDPHSDVAPVLINNCKVIPNHIFVQDCLIDLMKYYDLSYGNITLIIPDAGAQKKMYELKKYLDPDNRMGLVKCDKTRNVRTGRISNFEVHSDDLTLQTCVVIDDICDGGRTFLGLASELEKKGAETIILIVTHGIFSKGFDSLLGYYDRIYYSDSFPEKKYVNESLRISEKVKYIKVHL